MVARALSDKQELHLIHLYRDCYVTTPALSKMYKVGQSTIVRIFRRRKIICRKRPGHICYKCDEHFFDKIDTEAKAYFFGLLFADGYNSWGKEGDKVDIVLKLQEKDKEILIKFNKLINKDRPILIEQKRKVHWQDQHRVCINSKHMCQVLNSYGLIKRKSNVKKFPQIILDSNEDIQRHFIRGYFDGNGYIGDTLHCGEFRLTLTSTNDMCDNFYEVVNKYLSLNFKKSINKSNKLNDINCYQLNVYNLINVYAILNWMYKDSKYHIDRKYDKYLKIKKDYEKKVNLVRDSANTENSVAGCLCITLGNNIGLEP